MRPRPRVTASLDAAIEGSWRDRFIAEWLTNSAVFPIANVLLEWVRAGGPAYLREPDFYAITVGSVAQALFLSARETGPRPFRFLGNLIAPAFYTASEMPDEGLAFLQGPHHVAYWAFALAIGAVQHFRWKASGRVAYGFGVVESVVRTSFVLALYAIFEFMVTARQDGGASPFFEDSGHVFMAWAVVLLGLLGGMASARSQRYLDMLREVSRRLRLYSEWLLGRRLLERAVGDPGSLGLARRRRAILFADIRGFTAWSERQGPERVADLLNAYYTGAGTALAAGNPIRVKFTADEVMAIFPSARRAGAAARALARDCEGLLEPAGLGAGIGLHWGPVTEGLMGTADIRWYDAMGDTVNTAKRIEGAAGRGEILASSQFIAASRVRPFPASVRSIAVKGKAAPLAVYVLAGPGDRTATAA